MNTNGSKSRTRSRLTVGVLAVVLGAGAIGITAFSSSNEHTSSLPTELNGVQRAAAWGPPGVEAMAGSDNVPQSASFVSEFALYGTASDPLLIVGKYTTRDDATNLVSNGDDIVRRALPMDLATKSQTRSEYVWTDPGESEEHRALTSGEILEVNPIDGSCYAQRSLDATTIVVVTPTCDADAVASALDEMTQRD